MILVDTSIWIDHIRTPNSRLIGLLDAQQVGVHTWVVGELACGNLAHRANTLYLLRSLPRIAVASDDEVLFFIEKHGIAGKGVGYLDMHLLAAAPAGTQLAGATGGPQQVTLVYTGAGLNGGLWLQEGPLAGGEQQVWKVAANTRVEAVSVGSTAGEYVEGGWFAVDTNDGTLSWHVESGARTLRWEAGGMRYSLVFLAAKNITGSLLDKDALLDLASHLVLQNAETATPSPTPALSLAQLSQQTGFDVRLPAWAPDGYVFQEATYSPQRNGACLYYRYQEGIDGWPLLTIFETTAALTPSLADIKNDPVYLENGKQIEIPMDASPLPVGGAEGGMAQFMENGVAAGKLCSYPGLIGNEALVWQANGKGYVIFGLLDQFQGRGFISRLEMQRLAESLTGVNTIPAGTLDPERLRTVEDASSLAGFAVKQPTQMLGGMYFDHAVVRTSDKLKEVYLIYTGASNGDGRRYSFFFSQSVGETQPMQDTFLAGGYEHLVIAAQPGIYREICWSNAISSGSECNQEATWFEDGTRFDIQAYLPGAMEKAAYLSIAGSMR